MPKFRLMASAGWIYNSQIELGEDDFDTPEDAQQAAWESAAERLEAWAEEIDDEPTQ